MLVVTQALKTEVHQVLVEMAQDFQLDGDINEVDIDSVFDKAVEKVKENDHARIRHEAEVLSFYIGVSESLLERKKLVQAKEAGYGGEAADSFITISEAYEDFFTVNDLLTEIAIR